MKKKIIYFLLFLMLYNYSNAQTPYLFKGALLEYFTGHRAPNSPGADSMASFLKAHYNDSIAIINIHAGFFASPNSNFPEDLRSATGTAIDNFFCATNCGTPIGMVNRKDFNTSHLLGKEAWQNSIQNTLSQSPSILIDQANVYNNSNRTVSISVYTKALTNLNGNYYLSVYLTEDSIISPMQTLTGIDTYHVNNNLLRTALNGTWGTLICSDTFHSDSVIIRNFNYQLNSAWKENHCKLVCFLYNDATKEVIQISQKAVLNNTPSTLSINNINNNNIHIFPNPFKYQTTLLFSEDQKTTLIKVTDIMGKEVFHSVIKGKQFDLDMTNNPKGIYFVYAIDEKNTVFCEKIIKQ